MQSSLKRTVTKEMVCEKDREMERVHKRAKCKFVEEKLFQRLSSFGQCIHFPHEVKN